MKFWVVKLWRRLSLRCIDSLPRTSIKEIRPTVSGEFWDEKKAISEFIKWENLSNRSACIRQNQRQSFYMNLICRSSIDETLFLNIQLYWAIRNHNPLFICQCISCLYVVIHPRLRTANLFKIRNVETVQSLSNISWSLAYEMLQQHIYQFVLL